MTAHHSGFATTRRTFLAGLGLAAGATAVTSCSSEATRSAPSLDTFTALYEGAGTSEVVDPHTATMFIDEARLKHVYDGLFEVDSTMTPIPRLAVEAEPNADGTRWRLTLRDAVWHDGSRFAPEDVLFSLGRILGAQQGAAPFVAATTLSQVDLRQCRTVGQNSVEIALRSPSFDFPALLTAYGTRIIKAGTTDLTKPVGTGAFRFDSFTAGREFVATGFEDHWDGAPRIGELRILSAGPDARVSALQSGQAQFIDSVSPSGLRVLEKAKGLVTHQASNSGILYFAMKTHRPPFDNPDVRRAMMRLVDRDELVKVALEGSGEVSDDIFGRGYHYYADDLPPHEHDPDEAGRLLRKAGVKDLSFELYVAPVAHGFVEAARLFAEQAKEAGVTVRISNGSEDTYYTDALEKGDMTMGQSGPLAIPYHFGSRLLSDAPKNYTHWADPAFDALYRRAQRTSSDEQRTRIYHRMHEILHDRGGFIFWATTPWNTAAKDGYQRLPEGTVNAFDWARFDDVTTNEVNA